MHVNQIVGPVLAWPVLGTGERKELAMIQYRIYPVFATARSGP